MIAFAFAFAFAFGLASCRSLVVVKQIIDTYTRQHRRTQIIYIFTLYECRVNNNNNNNDDDGDDDDKYCTYVQSSIKYTQAHTNTHTQIEIGGDRLING